MTSETHGPKECQHIPLSRGLVAIVDDRDFDELNQWKWYATSWGSDVYACRTVHSRPHRKVILMAREIMDAKPGEIVDHRNGNTLDNRLENLRLCTRRQNIINRRLHPTSKTGFKGVYPIVKCKTYRAILTLNRRAVLRKHFPTAEEAARAWDEAAIKYFGEFAVLNFKRPGYRWIGDQITMKP